MRFANQEPPYEFPFFKVTFANDQLKNDAKKIRYVLHCKIRWETYKNPRKSTMCYKCQGHGHGTKSCFQKVKCLKCLKDHDTRNCTIQHVEDVDKRCANCPGNHLSNDPNCPVYLKRLESINKRRNRTPNQLQFPETYQVLPRVTQPQPQKPSYSTVTKTLSRATCMTCLNSKKNSRY